MKSTPSFLSKTCLLLAFTVLHQATIHAADPVEPKPEPMMIPSGELEFIDTSFENASPLWYDRSEDGIVHLHLLYDHERNAPNRAAGHFHFLIHAKTGTKLTFEFENLMNIYNGSKGSVARELTAVAVSEDGKHWKSLKLESRPLARVLMNIEMPGPKLYVARVEPYRLSDLDQLLASIQKNPLVEVTPIGKTVEGRQLEIVRVGNANAPYRVFMRARAHPWESGGSWVVQGLIKRLLKEDEESKQFLKRYCLYVLPMTNKDGVMHGRTRFNVQGKDLNRNWDQPIDPLLAPENEALDQWLKDMIKQGLKPQLGLEMHNDGRGLLHISNAPAAIAERYAANTKTFEELLRKHTWFTEGSKPPGAKNTGNLADGLLDRYNIDAMVHELNCNWIEGLKEHPSSENWQLYGAQLAKVFYEYFEVAKP